MGSEDALKRKKLYLLDLDGTLYIDDRLIDGAADFLRDAGSKGRVVYLSNNSSRGTDSYLKKFRRLGIDADADDFLTSADALIHYLKVSYGPGLKKEKIYVMGTGSFRKQLEDSGYVLWDEDRDGGKDPSMVILGFDRELTFRKLEIVSRLLTVYPRMPYIATNPDWVCPAAFYPDPETVKAGEKIGHVRGSVPDCGSMAEMLRTATGRSPKFIGKPEPLMIEMAMKRYGYSAEETLVIGDRIYTDIASGSNAGVDTAFVLSGEGTEEDIVRYGVKPTYIFNSIKEIPV